MDPTHSSATTIIQPTLNNKVNRAIDPDGGTRPADCKLLLKQAFTRHTAATLRNLPVNNPTAWACLTVLMSNNTMRQQTGCNNSMNMLRVWQKDRC